MIKLDIIFTGAPVLIWGAPGVGKTAAIVQFAKQSGLPCEVVLASIREPADFSGLPIIHEGGVRFAPPNWAVRLAEAGRGILFFDEISTAPPAVQAALLRVVLDRVVGDLQLPKDIYIIAAANPPHQAAGGWELSPPLANRFAHLEWTVDPREWAQEFPRYWGAPPSHPYPEAWSIARSEVAGFIAYRPTLLLAPPTNHTENSWASPRSWDNASRMLAYIRAEGGTLEDALPYIAGAVGKGAGMEFYTWLREADLPDPESVLQNPNLLPDRADKLYAVLGAVVQLVGDDHERYQKAWHVIDRAADIAVDIAAVFARDLIRTARQQSWATPATVKRFIPLLKEVGALG